MNTTTTSITSVLNSLIETCKDGQEGFRTAAENVKSADSKALFFELATQRQQFASELQGLVDGLGDEPEKSGSIAGALHRGWIDLKAAVTNDDEHSILAECERGEDSAAAEYHKALEQNHLPQNVRAIVERQATAVQAAHDRVRALRDRPER
ncbi:MAG: PA2169 family four-helix-bundle protein [Chthoniobacteraceae bacterium]